GHVEKVVAGGLVGPGRDRGPPLESAEGAAGSDPGLLHGVLGVEGRAEHAGAEGDQFAAVDLEVTVECESGFGGHPEDLSPPAAAFVCCWCSTMEPRAPLRATRFWTRGCGVVPGDPEGCPQG